MDNYLSNIYGLSDIWKQLLMFRGMHCVQSSIIGHCRRVKMENVDVILYDPKWLKYVSKFQKKRHVFHI